MARAKPGSRKGAVRSSAEEGRSSPERSPVGETNGTAPGAAPAPRPAAELLPAEAPVRGIARETKRQLSIIRGSTALGSALRVRHALREAMLTDVFDFLRTLMDAGSENPEKFGHLGYEAAKLVLDKLTGFPQAPYDEQEAMGVQVVEGSAVEKAASDVTKQLSSAPLDQYLQIAEKGRLPSGPK